MESGLWSGVPLELSRANEVQRGVMPDWTVETGDGAGQSPFRFGPGLEAYAPYQRALLISYGTIRMTVWAGAIGARERA